MPREYFPALYTPPVTPLKRVTPEAGGLAPWEGAVEGTRDWGIRNSCRTEAALDHLLSREIFPKRDGLARRIRRCQEKEAL